MKSLREDFKPLNLFIIFGPSFISEISREDIRDIMKSQCYGGSIILCHTLVILCSLWQSETIKWAPKSCLYTDNLVDWAVQYPLEIKEKYYTKLYYISYKIITIFVILVRPHFRGSFYIWLHC